MLSNIGLFLSRRSGGALSGAASLLAAETNGLAIDFTDMSMVIKDTTTPANTFSGDPNSKLTYASPSTKWVLGKNGLYSSGTTLRTEYNTSGVALGVRIEEARTNVLTYSQLFSDASWTKEQQTLTGGIASPDGGTNAFQSTPNTTFGVHRVYKNHAAGANTYTLSVYAKAAGYNWCYIDSHDGTNPRVTYFDLSNGTIGTVAAGVTATIQSVGNGWYRCTATAAYTAGGYAIVSSTTGNNVFSFSGDAVSGVNFWQMQFEVGSFATSPIVTAGSTVTRAADNISIATALFPYDVSHSIYAKLTLSLLSTSTVQRVSEIYAGASDIVRLYANNTAGNRGLTAIASGSGQGFTEIAGAATSSTKVGYAVATNSAAFSANGAIATDATFSVPSGTAVKIGSSFNGFDQLNGHMANLVYLPRRMSNSELQAITA